MQDFSGNVSYLIPRDPSLNLRNRPFEFKRTNLLSLFENEVSVSKSEKLRVYLRIKPSKKDATQDRTFVVKDSQTLVTRTLKDPAVHEFKFTNIFNDDASQEKLYTECVHGLVKNFINGENCLLFAYGTSSAGKTYTIQGTSQEPGIIPRAINDLFNCIRGKESHTCRFKPDMVSRVLELDDKAVQQELAHKRQIMTWSRDKYHVFSSQITDTSSDKQSECTLSSIDSQVSDFVCNTFREMQSRLNGSLLVNAGGPEVVYSTWVSFAEVYNENVYDLLEPMQARNQKRQNLPLGEDIKGQVYIKGLRHVCVSSGDEAYQVMLYGQHNLKFAPTGLNSVSSRSHCIFTVKLLQHVKCEHPKFVRVSMFSFCDLAGAERIKNTQNVGERLRESQNINTSLLVLGRCLKTIRDNQMQKCKMMIPFRDSKLTRLFQSALNGKESVTMVVNVNPNPVLWEETFNVLTFSAIAKQIILLPARRKKRDPRSSRFFRYISRNSTLPSNTTNTSEGDASTSSVSTIREIQQLHDQIETLANKIHELKLLLATERKARQTVETEVRRELCEYFSKMMVEAQAEWESVLKETQLRYEQMGDWRVAKLQNYYQQQEKTRKRPCPEDSSEDANCTLQDTDAEVACLTEKLNVTNELLVSSQKERNELSRKYSKLMFQLAECQTALKNSERVKEAAEAACGGDQSVLTKELESQLATAKEELRRKQEKVEEFEDILKDAEVDCKQLEEDLKATENERDDLEVRLAEKESELGRCLDATSDKQNVLDKQMCSLNEKDERIEILEKQLKELQEKYDVDIKPMTLEEDLKKSIEDNKLLKSDMTDLLKNHEENTNENKHLKSEIQELKMKLKESEDKLLQSTTLERIRQKEVQELNHMKDGLEYKISALENDEKKTIKEMISAQNSAEEHRKQLEESTSKSQKEISQLKVQLQSCMDNADFVRLLKEELESKSFKYEQLENENESLKRTLQVKEIEFEHFKENRDQLLKSYEVSFKKEKEESERHRRDVKSYQQMFLKSTPTPNKNEYEKRCTSLQSRAILENQNTVRPAKIRKLNDDVNKKEIELKNCYVKIQKLEDMHKTFEDSYDGVRLATCSNSKDSKIQQPHSSRKKGTDENTCPLSQASCEKKHTTSRIQPISTGKKRDYNEKTKTKSRRRQLFQRDPDDLTEISQVETDDMPGSMSPRRILRSHRL